MRFTQLSEIPELSDGVVIEGIKGTCTKVGKRRAGEGEYGPYSYQTIELSDGQLRISVDVGGKDTLESFKGKFLCLLSGKDKKGQVSGLKVADREYNGKLIREIKANVLTEITETVPASQIQQPPAKAQPTAAQPGETAAQKLLRERKEAAERGEKPPTTVQSNGHEPNAQERLGQWAYLMYLCRRASFAVAKRCVSEDALNMVEETSINSMAVSMFISAEREGLDRGLAPFGVAASTGGTPAAAFPPEPPEEDDVPF